MNDRKEQFTQETFGDHEFMKSLYHFFMRHYPERYSFDDQLREIHSKASDLVVRQGIRALKKENVFQSEEEFQDWFYQQLTTSMIEDRNGERVTLTDQEAFSLTSSLLFLISIE